MTGKPMAVSAWPDWAETLKRQYLAGSSSFFILHGNVDDPVGSTGPGGYVCEPLADFLAVRVFSSYDLVLHYDLGRGLRPNPGGDPLRLTRMNALMGRLLEGPEALPRDPGQALRLLDRLITRILLAGSEKSAPKAAFLFDYAELICPPGERYAENLALFLNWARSPVVQRVNLLFILMTSSLSQLNPALVQSGYTSEIPVPMPGPAQRRRHIEQRFADLAADAERLARLGSGLTLANIDNLLRLTRKEIPVGLPGAVPETQPPARPAGGVEVGDELLRGLKKELIEAQCPGLIEFIEPHLDLSLVAGHTAAKKRLADDALLIRQGELSVAPMGYLICGPVGVGKTFLTLCYAGSVGIPCITIRNFRSKYVGETEANLEKILRVLRELGPVAVIVDEADAAVGSREASGDSGTSARVFAQLSSQMGDTRYRGRMIWFLLTCRPDLLPVDLKRQGRCEEHIPLFYPETEDERREMFLAMARKQGLALAPEMIPGFLPGKSLSGADIEGVLTRARRESMLRGEPISRVLIEDCMAKFISLRGPDHELQWLAAILECTDTRYLPEAVRQVVETEGGLARLAQRYQELRASID